MPLTPGTRLGPYEIVAPVGAGGMGEVYKARDTNLARDVALKILPDSFAKDPDRLMRFEREARTLASLNHPHIAQIHGLEQAGPSAGSGQARVRALVMEFVDGQDLSQRIARGPLPLDEALPIARQIVEALEAAHDKGIIHRDLKPANIMVTAEGQVKVLDFGLAKALAAESTNAGADQSPTITSPAVTRAGVILGTAAYMSPEQVKGRAADKRSDVWAFGCVLYEMLAGTRAFHGDGVNDTLAAVLRGEPDWPGLPSHVPAHIRRLLKHCLDKDRMTRIADASTLRYILDEGAEAATTSSATAQARPAGWRRALPWTVAIGAIAVAGALVIRPAPQGTAQVVRSTIPLAPEAVATGGGGVAFAPDGASVVYLGRVDGRSQLYHRRLSETRSVAISGTEDAEDGPFFSPDGQWVGFVRGSQLLKVPLGGGLPTAICEVESYAGTSWGDDGFIVIGTQQETGLLRVRASGGPVEPLTVPTPEDQGNDHRFPQILPGGRGVIFMVGTGPEDTARILVLDSRTGARKELLRGSASARYVPTGHLVYARNAELFAVPFDLSRLEVSGSSVRITNGVAEQTNGAPEYSFSAGGDLVYVPGWSGGPRNMLAFVDLQGTVAKTAMPPGPFADPQISPDGRRIALTMWGAKNNIWVYDTERATATRVTFGRYHRPLWTPDGRLTASKGPPDRLQLIRRSADGSGTDEEITAVGPMQFAGSWTPDGRTLYYERQHEDTQWDLWTVSPGLREPAPIVATRFNESEPRLSPDARWLAYASDENGRAEIYVRALEGTGQRWPVSVDGAAFPVWSPDGRRLYYVGPDGPGGRVGMLAVDIATSPSFHASRPRLLFPTSGFSRQFDITPDGTRFVMIQVDTTPPPHQLHLVLNWFKTRPVSAARQ